MMRGRYWALASKYIYRNKKNTHKLCQEESLSQRHRDETYISVVMPL